MVVRPAVKEISICSAFIIAPTAHMFVSYKAANPDCLYYDSCLGASPYVFDYTMKRKDHYICPNVGISHEWMIRRGHPALFVYTFARSKTLAALALQSHQPFHSPAKSKPIQSALCDIDCDAHSMLLTYVSSAS
ncbi:hypothetical protein LshimejAT787_0209310 [Lyophyllum shimeji]|uniref:Uncharacterized protein n=1 Tax=Lyophyllum shimeji TaxID=47721 RepID=A0A9P3ULG5_LYOSH|nr:hypothetical protein LshimejAT787_0209310 [Lyophyllum shimeji]